MHRVRKRPPAFWFSLTAVTVVLAVVGMLAVRLWSPGAAEGSLRLEVDISERKMYVHHGGEVVATYDVAVGQPGHPTPTGNYSISQVIWNPAWVPPDREWAAGETRKAPGDPDNPMVAAKLMFDPPYYYIHGTNAPGSLGKAASHGCVRMSPSAVVSVGKRVMAHGGAGRSAEWYDNVLNSNERHSVSLPNPVPLEIHP